MEQGIARVVRTHGERIVARWKEAAGRTVAARGLSDIEIENLVSQVLLALSDGDPGSSLEDLVQSHLGSRISYGFELAEVVHEFSLLETAVLETCATLPEPERPSTAAERRFSRDIRRLMVRATALYKQHMMLDEQRDKRYLRGLQRIATEALHDPDRPLDARLDEVLELVMDGMGGRSAALLLHEPALGRLVMRAAVGLGRDVLLGRTPSICRSGWVVGIARRNVPTSTAEVETLAEDGPALEAAGILSLIGARVPSTHDGTGVLLVGVTERRTFSAREAMRIEQIGRWLGLHLDNASLVATLRRTADALRSERQIRERFVAMLAHDVRGPLSVSRMAGRMLAHDPQMPEHLQPTLTRLDRSLGAAERLVRDLLDVHRVHAGKPLPLKIERFDLVALACEVLHEVEELHGPRFTLDADPVIEGWWSREELARALWNLADNAVKHGVPNGHVTIGIHGVDDRAVLRVRNPGPEIPPERRERMFDPYVSEPGGGCAAPGFGLGLALVKAVSEAHGGRVEISWDEGWTTFSVELPRDARGA